MGKLKNEMRKIHAKKIKKAKERLKSYQKKEISETQLNSLAKKMLKKKNKKNKS